jgi:hypothetical protein
MLYAFIVLDTTIQLMRPFVGIIKRIPYLTTIIV